MSWIQKLQEDLEFWKLSEGELSSLLKDYGRTVEATPDTDILDFKIIDKHWKEVWLELKTRRCDKSTYPDTMIGINKLIEAFKRYNDDGLFTLFLFKFTDWLYYINPFLNLPRFDYRKGRYDRLWIDSEKWWCYYLTEDLKKL